MTRVFFAAEHLLPAGGGAERFALELLAVLAERRNEVRAVWLADAPDSPAAVRDLPAGVTGRVARAPMRGGYWANKAARREALREAVAAEPPADVVVTQLHAAPGVVEAAGDAATVLLVPSYESLCKYAFDAGSTCGDHRDCVRCPRARALPDAEAAALRVSRTAHEAALRAATVLVAPSRYVAAAVERWCGRRPEVVAWAGEPPRGGQADRRGHVLLAAAWWNENKGASLLAPLAAQLPDRELVVTASRLEPDDREALAARGNVWFMDAPIDRLLQGASVCLVPSRWPEPFGRVAFEAQAAGIPVIATDVGGLAEHVPAAARLPLESGAAEWAAAVRKLESPAAWREAREAALAAAATILRERPLERAAALVEGAAPTRG